MVLVARIVLIASLLSVASAAYAQKVQPVQVMVLGTYHFDNPGRDLHNPKVDDVLKPQRQRELEALAKALAEFRPNRIMVERVAKTSDLVDPHYSRFTPADLSKNRDERVQIGYRLASQLRLQMVYAIDEQSGPGEPDYFPFGNVAKWAEAHSAKQRLGAVMEKGAAASSEIEQLQKQGSIASALRELNQPERAAAEQTIYYDLLGFGDTEQQPGADLNAMWYLRNAKIFAKLRSVTRPGDRVLVIYGSGHNYWLRHFAEFAPGYVSVEPAPYLAKAAASPR
jgi:hypothetical protein